MMIGELDLTLMGTKALFEAASSKDSEKLTEAKTDAIHANVRRCTEYLRRGYDHKIVLTALEKKLKLICESATVARLKKLKGPSAPRYSCGKFFTDDTWVPEEELIQWSLASLEAPLPSDAFDRYIDLFKQVTGIDILSDQTEEHTKK